MRSTLGGEADRPSPLSAWLRRRRTPLTRALAAGLFLGVWELAVRAHWVEPALPLEPERGGVAPRPGLRRRHDLSASPGQRRDRVLGLFVLVPRRRADRHSDGALGTRARHARAVHHGAGVGADRRVSAALHHLAGHRRDRARSRWCSSARSSSSSSAPKPASSNIDKRLIETARSFTATEWAILRKIVLPAALPYIIARHAACRRARPHHGRGGRALCLDRGRRLSHLPGGRQLRHLDDLRRRRDPGGGGRRHERAACARSSGAWRPGPGPRR